MAGRTASCLRWFLAGFASALMVGWAVHLTGRQIIRWKHPEGSGS